MIYVQLPLFLGNGSSFKNSEGKWKRRSIPKPAKAEKFGELIINTVKATCNYVIPSEAGLSLLLHSFALFLNNVNDRFFL